MIDYTFLYKKEINGKSDWDDFEEIDIFISAYNLSDRVKYVFKYINSKLKFWLIFPEYQFKEEEIIDSKNSYFCTGQSEGDQILDFFNSKKLDLSNKKIAIDITGFMIPQLAFLLKFLYNKKLSKIEMFYSEPMQYLRKEKTSFSDGNVTEVRQIMGFEGFHQRKTDRDLLIIGSGYDHHLVKRVCNFKEHAKTIQIIGFPSLKPDMYQENILKIALASDALGNSIRKPQMAPANDPFSTAQKLSEILIDYKNQECIDYSNLYLCPLASKPQALGFILVYISELQNKHVSLIYPFVNSYEKKTSLGINKTWKYTLEFLNINDIH